MDKQRCVICDDATVDDSIYFYDEGPLCEECNTLYEKLDALLFHQSRKVFEIELITDPDVRAKMQRNINKRERRIQRLRDVIKTREEATN